MKIKRDALKLTGLIAFVLTLVVLAFYEVNKLDDKSLKEERRKAEIGYLREKDDTATKEALTGDPSSPTFAAPIPSQNNHAGTFVLMGNNIDWNDPSVYQLKILADRVEIWAVEPGKPPRKIGEKFPANSSHCRQIRAGH